MFLPTFIVSFRKEEGYCRICFNADNDEDFSIGSQITTVMKVVVQVNRYLTYILHMLLDQLKNNDSSLFRVIFAALTGQKERTMELLDHRIAL